MRTSDREPKDLMVLAQCPKCFYSLGLFHLVEGGVLVLGALGCENCGHVGKAAHITPCYRGLPPSVPTRIELDSVVHFWPEVER